MTEIRPPKTLNHIFPEKVFYAFSLKNHRSICRKSGAGPALARLRILCTQKIRSPSSFCFDSVYCIRKRSRARAHFAPIAYTMYAKDSEPELILPRLRILCTQRIRSPSSNCLVCVYCIRKRFGPGLILPRLRILCTQKIRARAHFCLVCVYYVRKRFGAWAQAASSAYTMYAKNRIRALGCLVCVYYVRKRSRARAHSALIAYTVYAKDPGPELILLR